MPTLGTRYVYCLLTDGGTVLWLPSGESIMETQKLPNGTAVFIPLNYAMVVFTDTEMIIVKNSMNSCCLWERVPLATSWKRPGGEGL